MSYVYLTFTIKGIQAIKGIVRTLRTLYLQLMMTLQRRSALPSPRMMTLQTMSLLVHSRRMPGQLCGTKAEPVIWRWLLECLNRLSLSSIRLGVGHPPRRTV